MRDFLKTVEYYLYKPVVENLPFFVIFSALFLPHVLTGLLNDALNRFTVNSLTDSLGIFVYNAAIVLGFAYLICLAIHITHSRIIKVCCYAFSLLLFGINMYLRICFGTLLSSKIIMLIAETNKNETMEFLQTFVFRPTSIVIVITVAVAVLLLDVIERWYHKKSLTIKSAFVRRTIAIGMAVIIYLTVIETTTYANTMSKQTFASFDKLLGSSKYSRMDYCRKMINSIYFYRLSSDEMKEALSITMTAVKEDITRAANDSLNIIVIIGESFIRSHASVYGYELNTMPYMNTQKAKGNLTLFNHVITTAKYTSVSLRNFFSCNSAGDDERWSQAAFFPILFKAAGFSVYYWDNQYDASIPDNDALALNSYVHHDSISRITYDAVNGKSFQYDGELVEDFIGSCLPRLPQDGNSLVMFHLMGQHFKTNKRYPQTDEFRRFTADSIRRQDAWLTDYKKEEIASYDNAVYYNDCVLRKIIESFEYKNTILLFFSDHGELVYDVSDVVGRTKQLDNATPEEIAHYYDIPMMFWYSNRYKSKHPDMVSLLEASKDKPLMSDNICQLLFHLADIHSKWYRPERDVLHADYACPSRIIENTLNYDTLKKQHK